MYDCKVIDKLPVIYLLENNRERFYINLQNKPKYKNVWSA